jgi:hypothetical protein
VRDTLASIAADRPGKLVQVCYTVPDIDKAALAWAADGVGPFFRARFELGNQLHRGRPTEGAIEAAIGYRDDVNIELVEYQGSGHCVFAEIEPGRRFGLHHLQIATADYDAALASHDAAGETVVVNDMMEGIGRAGFADTRARFGHYLEYGVWTPAVLHALDVMIAAHRGWDGRDPLRPYVALQS